MDIKTRYVKDKIHEQVTDSSGNNVIIRAIDNFRAELRDNNGVLIAYIDNLITKAIWEWDRNGGCGLCQLTLKEAWDGDIGAELGEDYEVRLYLTDVFGIERLRYSGYIDRIAPDITGSEETIELTILGYANQLKNIIVRDKTYTGQEVSAVVKDILDTYITGQTKITSVAADYEDTEFTADNLYFDESAYEAINKLADIAGKREWGVRADKSFFFKKRCDCINHFFFVGKDLDLFRPIQDFNPIISGIYLEGGGNYSASFSVVNKIATKERILRNSSITTQSVGQQYARVFLKKNGKKQVSYIGHIPEYNGVLEGTVPLGKAVVDTKINVKSQYDTAGLKYDSGVKYDGGTANYQIEKIRYELKDGALEATLYFGRVPPALSDELARLEYMLNNERNI